jgi:hypothetical protein
MASLTIAQAKANVEASYVEVRALERLSDLKRQYSLKGSNYYDANNVPKCLRHNPTREDLLAGRAGKCIEYIDNLTSGNKQNREILDLLNARPGGIRGAYKASDFDAQVGRVDADLAKARAASKLAESVLRELQYPTRDNKAAVIPRSTTPAIAAPKPPKKAPKKPLPKPKGRR